MQRRGSTLVSGSVEKVTNKIRKMADERSGEEETVFRLDAWLVENILQSEATDAVSRSLIMVYTSLGYVDLCEKELLRCKRMANRGAEYQEFQSFWETLLEFWATKYEKWGNYIDHKENGKKH